MEFSDTIHVKLKPLFFGEPRVKTYENVNFIGVKDGYIRFEESRNLGKLTLNVRCKDVISVELASGLKVELDCKSDTIEE